LDAIGLWRALPGAFFSSVSEEKKQKKTAFAAKLAHKKETTANRQPLPAQNTLPHIRFSGGYGRGLFPGKSLLPPAPPESVPAVYPAGGLLFFCVRRKEAKEDRICSQVSKQKETTANRQPLPAQKTLPHIRFSGGCGRGLFPGKSLLPPAPPQPVPAVYPAGGLLFSCVRRKEAKEDRICSQISKQKETTAHRQSLSAQNIYAHMRFSGGSGRGLFPGKSLLPPAPPQPVPAV